MHAGPEDPNSRTDFFFVGQKPQFLPPVILQILIHVGWNPEMARNMKVIIRRLEILDPALSGDADLGLTEEVDVRGRIRLKRGHDDRRDIVHAETLALKDVLGPLVLASYDRGFGVSEKTDPCLIQHRKVL